jgi:dipeptidyl-peptidase-4
VYELWGKFSGLLLFVCFTVLGQKKNLGRTNLYGSFPVLKEWMNCNPWKNTNQYTVLNQDQNGEQQIDLFWFYTLKKVSNLDNHQLF